MKGYIYRYTHPQDPTRFIYVGQGKRRHAAHRAGRSSFGRRFKVLFPGIQLLPPVVEEVEVNDRFRLNELETIAMFRFHSWRGYAGGMNLTIPGSADYLRLGRIAVETGSLERIKTKESMRKGGHSAGLLHVASGHLARISSKGGSSPAGFAHKSIIGKHNARTGLLDRIRLPKEMLRELLEGCRTPEHQRRANVAANHKRWHTNRNSASTTCVLCQLAAAS